MTASSTDKKGAKTDEQLDGEDEDEDMSEDTEAWSAEAHFTNANYQAKKMTLLLFINRKSVSTRVLRPAGG